MVSEWELADGGNLWERLKRCEEEGRSGLPLRELLRYMADAAEGIDFLNGRGIYHRDIKPSNLLLFHGRVKVGDLGLAKFVGASTGTYTGAGTWGYLPPEAYDHHRLSRTVDLYGLAATYVELRTGRKPFGEEPAEIWDAQRAGRPRLEGLGRHEAEVVRQALAAEPASRPQDGGGGLGEVPLAGDPARPAA